MCQLQRIQILIREPADLTQAVTVHLVVPPGVAVILRHQERVQPEAVTLLLPDLPEVLLPSAEVQEVAVAVAVAAEAEVQDQVVVVQELLQSVNFLFLFGLILLL